MQRNHLNNRENARQAGYPTLFLHLAVTSQSRFEPAQTMGNVVANVKPMTPEQQMMYNNPIQVAIRENTKDLRGTQYDPIEYADYAAANPSFW